LSLLAFIKGFVEADTPEVELGIEDIDCMKGFDLMSFFPFRKGFELTSVAGFSSVFLGSSFDTPYPKRDPALGLLKKSSLFSDFA